METTTINGRSVTLYSTGAWFYDDSEITEDEGVFLGPNWASQHDGRWFRRGDGVAVR